MADHSKRVMDMVRREMAKNPDVKSGPLYEKAKKLDRSIRSLSLRQFHARYPLQFKRLEAKASRGGRKRTAAKATRKSGRKAVRRKSVRRKVAAAPKPARRKAGRPAGVRKTSTRRAAVTDRDGVRRVLLDFAGEVANAENKADMIAVIGRLDGWIDRLVGGN